MTRRLRSCGRYRAGIRSSVFLVTMGVLVTVLSGCQATQPKPDGMGSIDTESLSEKPISRLKPLNTETGKGEELERVSGLEYDGNTLTLTVLSNGCTRANHFRVDSITESGACIISIVRTKPDLCRMSTTPVSISIEWEKPEECDSLRLANPILEYSVDQSNLHKLFKQNQ